MAQNLAAGNLDTGSHDNTAEALKNYVANTAVSWPTVGGRPTPFLGRSPDQMPTTAAPWTSPWPPPSYEQNFWMPLGVTRSMVYEVSPILATGKASGRPGRSRAGTALLSDLGAVLSTAA